MDTQERSLDIEKALDVPLRDLRTSREGLSSAEDLCAAASEPARDSAPPTTSPG
jgi:hypothetical protein